MITFNCKNCGQERRASEGDVGRKVKCPRCGQLNVIPGEQLSEIAEAARQTDRGGTRGTGHASPSSEKRHRVATVMDSGEGGGDSRRLVWGLCAFAALFVGGLLLYVFVLRDTWELDHYAEIRSKADTVQALVNAGKLEECTREYERLCTLVGDRELDSEELRTSLASAERVAGEAETTLHRQRSIAKVRALESEASTLVDAGDFKAGVAKYRELDSLLARTVISDPSLDEIIERARKGRPIAEAKWRKMEAEIRRKEEERRLAEERRRIEEQRRREEEERLRREKFARQEALRKQRLVRELFKNSDTYSSLSRQARNKIASLRTSLVGEDSAWRSNSRRARTARELLGIYVKICGHIHGQDVSARVDAATREADRDLLAETSALRAIYKNDKAFFNVLGIWCSVLKKKHPALETVHLKKDIDVSKQMIAEDSAYRAISAYTRASLFVLQELVSAKGHGTKPASIFAKVTRDNLTDTSTIRGAMRNADGIMKLLLLLADDVSPDSSRRIAVSVDLRTATDESAIRAQSQYRQGIVDALSELISSL